MDDDPAIQWPAWKFGMKRDELFTTLYDQYNTIPSAIQDNEAFHHDVYEISNLATNAGEFHRLLADRKEQRIRELNGTLESASLEIISNPSLIGTQQWQHAVQLFRTRSLDSLVRYFASYLPDDHPWHHPSNSTSCNDFGDAPVPTSFIDDDVNQCGLTDEPISISIPASHLPPSPRSMTMCSYGSSAVSPTDDDSHHEYSLTPARTLSFSEPETDLMTFSGTLSRDHDDEMSQSDDPDTPTTSISDFSETRSLPEYPSKDEVEDESITPAACDDAKEEVGEGGAVSETPTPRNESSSGSYVNAKSPSSKDGPSPLYTHVLHEYARTPRKNRRDRSPGLSTRRRSPELGRVQKPLPDPIRSRPKGLVHMSRSHSRYP